MNEQNAESSNRWFLVVSVIVSTHVSARLYYLVKKRNTIFCELRAVVRDRIKRHKNQNRYKWFIKLLNHNIDFLKADNEMKNQEKLIEILPIQNNDT